MAITLPSTMYPAETGSPVDCVNNSGGISAGATSITLQYDILPTSGFPYLAVIGPSTGFNFSPGTTPTIEIVIVTANSSGTLTVTRGAGGTTAQSWAQGSRIAPNFTGLQYTNLVSNINTLATNADQKWTSILSSITTTPASTSTITTGSDLTGSIKVGYALTYTISSVAYYGRVTAITSSLITIEGPPLSGTITAISYADARSTRQITFLMTGYYAALTTAGWLNAYGQQNGGYRWEGPAAKIAGFRFSALSSDSGSSQPLVNLTTGTMGASTTSTTSITIGTGSKTFTTVSSGAYTAGQIIAIIDSASGAATNAMMGIVTSCTTTTLVVNVVAVTGSGTIATWTISAPGMTPISTSNSSAGLTTNGTTDVYTVVDISTSQDLTNGGSLGITVIPGASSPSLDAWSGVMTVNLVIP